MSERNMSANILGTEKIHKLLIKFAVPGVISLVVNSIYNIVDQIFIGQGVGFLGNAATNVIYPLVVLAIACGMLLGDGSASFMSLMLGRQKKGEASKGVAFGIVATIIVSVILAVLYLIFLNPLCHVLGGTDSNLQYCLDYGRIIAIGIPFCCISCSYSSMVRADGNPKFSMIGLLVGCVINLILDPVFILGFGWGVKGAAFATILGQIANAILLLIYVSKKFKNISITKASLRSWTSKSKEVSRLGISSFIFQFAIVIAIVIQNNVQVKYGAASIYGPDIPLAAFGVTMKVFMIVIAIIAGIAGGAQPIYGFNYGSGQHDRVKKTYKYVLIVSTIILCLAFAVFQLAPMAIVSIFGTQDQLYNEFAVRCLRIFLFALPISGVQMVSNTFFQAVGYPLPSSIISLSRQILFLIPLLLILSAIFGIDGCLYVGPAADACAFVLSLILLKIYWKKIFFTPDN